MDSNGYAGKILFVDLTSATTRTVPTSDYSGKFLGGRGIAARIYWDEVPAEAGPFSPDNVLIFSVGPLAGTPVIGGSRWNVSGKSPLASPNQFTNCNLGGHWGVALKFAGYDLLVIKGRAANPVYLLLHNDMVEIKDATAIWGKGAIETRELLKSELGNTARVVCIGPAGENRVTMASLLADNDASGSGGLGAVMGSKNLKAVAVQAAKKSSGIAKPERFKELVARYRSMEKGVFTAWGTDFMPKGDIRKDPCYGCLGNCLRVMYTAADGKRGKYMCQSGMFYQPWVYRHQGTLENDISFHAGRICNDYGLDTWSIDMIIIWLNRCNRAGILNQDNTGLPFDELGTLGFMESLVRTISYRQGIGDLLAEGRETAARALGTEALSAIRHSDPYEPRLYLPTALLWAMEPREPIQQLHEIGLPIAQWVSWATGIDGAYVSGGVLKGIAKRFWGSEAAADFTNIDGNALAAKMVQDREYAKECLVMCDWVWPVMESRATEDHVGDPTLESQILSAVTGNDIDEEGLYLIGERVFNLHRAISVREGRRGRHDDVLPTEWHHEPLKKGITNTEGLVPGKEGEAVSRIGSVVDVTDFEKMKDEYYQLRGWDVSSGLQTRYKLNNLGLDDIADEMHQMGLLHDRRDNNNKGNRNTKT